tara:strand:+ start:1435 stop:2058 length:624 start_codon:yes stop_codon:yes gene_type:complete
MTGQINRGEVLGDAIYELARDEQYRNYVEVGTWNGQGSTVCFWHGLSCRDDNWRFISFEANKDFHDTALNFFGDKVDAQFNLVHGRIVAIEDMWTLDCPHVKAHYENHVHKDICQRFFDGDLKAFKSCGNKAHLLNDMEIDVLLLDGGEFSTFAEFKLLKPRSKIIILDDTRELKTKMAHEELLNDLEWDCVIDSNARNGFSIHRKK